MIRLLVLFAVFVAGPSFAQSLPDRYSVTGVAADDVLNIRAEPTAASDKVGEFGPFNLNVEVSRAIDGWGQVPTPEGMGWVSMRFLTPNPWPAGQAPRPLICSGTEPFWTLAMYPRGAEYRALGEYGDTVRQLTILTESVAPNGFYIVTRDGPTTTRALMVDGRVCSDGMSDRPFGMTATLFSQSDEGNYMQTGCCTVQAN